MKFVSKGDQKFQKDGANFSRKPFISTVRSGTLLPNAVDGYLCEKGPYRVCSVCPNSRPCDGNRFEAEKLQNDIQNRDDTIDVLKKQIEARDREVERLGALLSGGRPITSLARDCCFRGVGSMAEDVELLQKQKCDLRRELNEAISAQHEAMQRAMRLAERNAANTIQSLKSDLERLQMGEVTDSVREKLVQALKKEKTLQMTIEKLQKKNTKLKAKVSDPKSSDSSRDETRDRELSLTKQELECLKREFATVQDKLRNNSDIKDLRIKLSEKELEIRNLHHELNQLRQEKMSNLGEICSARSLGQSSAALRQERERDIMRSDIEKVRIERDALRDRLKMATEAQMEEHRRYENSLFLIS
uniref:Uncharacterized protein n=1 Tax=Phlebotomus papatasi TaxID=29031 RepID=A0A1B0DEH0_PHLPP